MNLIFVGGRLYPFIAAALVVALYQFGVFYRRKNSPTQHYFWGISGFLILSAVLWLVFRGDLHSDEWLTSIFG